MTILHAIILGIVEGITEFLPISSTGHLILASNLLGLESTEFLKTFEIVIQGGAIISVLALAIKDIWNNVEIYKKIAIAFLPTAIIGLLAYKYVKQFLGNPAIVAWALIIGGIIMILVEWFKKENVSLPEDRSIGDISYKQSFLLGLFQSIALIPGISRSGATIIGGRLIGIGRKSLVYFSFLLAIPTLGAATGLDLLKTGFSFTAQEWLLLCIGAVTAAIVAYIAMRWFLRFISNHTFIPFGIYRIVVGILFLVFVL